MLIFDFSINFECDIKVCEHIFNKIEKCIKYFFYFFLSNIYSNILITFYITKKYININKALKIWK